MKRIGYIFSFLLIAVFCFPLILAAQNPDIDSILQRVKTEPEDTNRVIDLNTLAFRYIGISRFDTAMICGSKALELAQKLNYQAGISPSLTNIGIVHTNYGNFPKALEYYLKALKQDEKLNNKVRVGKLLSNIGVIYVKQREPKKALEYYTKALKLSEELGVKKSMAAVHYNIGNIYSDVKDYNTALDHYYKALKLDEEIGNTLTRSMRVGSIGVVYHELQDLEKAEKYYREALRFSQESGNEESEARYLCNIGSIYVEKKEYKTAEDYLLKALPMFEKIGFLEGLQETNDQLSQMYEGMRNSSKALKHYKLYTLAKDSLFNEEKNNEVVRHELTYEFEKKEAAYNAEQDKKAAVAESEQKKQSLLLLLIACVALAVSITALVIFRSLRTTRKQKKIIENQKTQVEEKQKEILDSIHYARRIQKTLMPTESYIERSLKRLIR